MNIQTAYKLTNTKNANQLAKFLDLSATAVYKWRKNGVVPVSGRGAISDKLGLLSSSFDEESNKPTGT